MYRLFVFLILLLLGSCKNSDDRQGEILARVGDEYLYSSELLEIIPDNTPARDSLILSKNFINNWVREKLIIRKAIMNLTDEQLDFEKQLDDYRNSLIIYQYKSMLISQKLDTVVTQTEIQKYFDDNIEAFRLKENLVRLSYVKINRDTLDVRKFEELIKSDDPDDISLLDSLCHAYALECYLKPNSWVSFNKLISDVPIETLDQENYLRNHRFVRINADEESDVYLLNFFEFSLKGEIAPVDYEKSNVKNLLLNKRKIKLINDMEKDIFDDGLNNNLVEIY